MKVLDFLIAVKALDFLITVRALDCMTAVKRLTCIPLNRVLAVAFCCILAPAFMPAPFALGNEPSGDGEPPIGEASADASSADATSADATSAAETSAAMGAGVTVPEFNGWYLLDDGKQQYFVDNLLLYTTWQYIEGSWYYFDDQANLVKERWLFANGYWYYLGADGRMLSSTITRIGSSTYAFNSAGVMIAGWLEPTDNAQPDSNSLNTSGVAAKSWQLIKGKWYYFAPDQSLLPNSSLVPSIYMDYGTRNIDGVVFELGGPEGGVMKTGWCWENGIWYYRNLESGRITTSDWLQINDNLYYLGDDGRMLTSTITQIGSSSYAFNDEGAMMTGWVLSPDDALLFFDPSGAAVTGWQYLYDNYYYFASEKNPSPDSRLSPGIYMAYGRQFIDTAFYYFGEPGDGTMKTGWQQINGSVNYYYANGIMATGEKVYAPSPGNLSYSNFSSDGQWLGFTTSGNHNPAWGMTYVEVNLSLQYLWIFQGGVCVLECEVVTGNPNYGWTTPTGTFSIMSMSRNVTISGPGYSVFVSYWMPFTAAGHGLHDASWQPSFGGDAYWYRGSHGCVNMPPWAAAYLYGMVSPGTPVIIHY